MSRFWFSLGSWHGLYGGPEESLHSTGKGFFHMGRGSAKDVVFLGKRKKQINIYIALLNLTWTFLLSQAEKYVSCHVTVHPHLLSPKPLLWSYAQIQWTVKSVSNRTPLQPPRASYKMSPKCSCGQFNCLLRLSGRVPNYHSYFFQLLSPKHSLTSLRRHGALSGWWLEWKSSWQPLSTKRCMPFLFRTPSLIKPSKRK